MISVCIPICNHDVRPLVRQLSEQAGPLGPEAVEIVCVDDHSDERWTEQNRTVADEVSFYVLGRRVGMARVRNILAKCAHGDYLLFLDSGSTLPAGFLANYWRYLEQERPAVVVGGCNYDGHNVDSNHRLRYLYGKSEEDCPAVQRRRHPYRYFMTNNVAVRRDVLQAVAFDEAFCSSGHDDVLFGYRLEQRGVPVSHIDNPVAASVADDNTEFLCKTAEAVKALAKVYRTMWEDQRFCQVEPLLSAYGRVRRWKLLKAVHLLFGCLRATMKSHFLAGRGISHKQYRFYRLGLLVDELNYPNVQE